MGTWMLNSQNDIKKVCTVHVCPLVVIEAPQLLPDVCMMIILNGLCKLIVHVRA